MSKSNVGKKEEVTSVNVQDSLSEKKNLTFLERKIRKGYLFNLPKIHPEFAGLLPVDEDSYKALEKMAVRDNTISSPIITCIIDGVEYVIDGHMRLDVATKKGIHDFTIETLTHIKTVEEGICWIIFNACSHRKLNRAQRVNLVRKLKPMIQAIAKANQKLGAELKGAFSKTKKAGKRIHVDKELARMAGTSPDFFRDADYVLDNGDAEEKKKLLEKGFGASALRDKIEKRLAPPDPETEVIPYINPKEGDYIDRIINGDCIQVMKDMLYNGINNVVLMATSINYNVGIDYGPDFSDDLPRDEYLENIAQSIYHAQLLGRDGMKICINCTDTNNKDAAEDGGDYQYDIGKDIFNKVDELNTKYEDCNLRYMGRFLWYKNHSNAPAYLGSNAAPVIKNDSEYILVWTKNQRKLENISGVDCKPGSETIFSDTNRDKYVITKKERMAWTYQTWCIPTCTDKELLKMHPCPFPEEIPHRLIKLFSNPNDIVIDPYMGLGTTCKVARDLKRRYVGIDQFSNFCEAAKTRIADSIKDENTTLDDLDDDSNYVLVA